MNRTALVLLSAVVVTTAGCTAQQDVEPGAGAPSAGAPAAANSVPLGRFTLAPDGTAADRDAALAAAQECVELPGVTWKPTSPGNPSKWRVTATGIGLRTFEPCVAKVVGYAAVPVADADAAFVEQCTGNERQFVVPSYIGLDENTAMRTKPTDAASRVGAVRVVARDGDCLPVTADRRPDRVDLVVRAGQVIWAGLPDVTAPGGTAGDDGIGLDICLDENKDCRSLDPSTSRRIRLALALDNAEPDPPGTAYCEAAGRDYTVLVHYDSSSPLRVTVPSLCAPMIVNGEQYPLDDFAREQVRLAYEAAQ